MRLLSNSNKMITYAFAMQILPRKIFQAEVTPRLKNFGRLVFAKQKKIIEEKIHPRQNMRPTLKGPLSIHLQFLEIP
jgi:hypothetical protein